MTSALHGVTGEPAHETYAVMRRPRAYRRAISIESPLRERHFLFLRGPFGAFFRQVAAELAQSGCRVTKIVFDGGDLSDWGYLKPHTPYREEEGAWPAWIDRFLLERRITDLVVFNDCIEVHMAAIAAAKRRGLRVHVFEEGYFRPRWITLETDGVNAYSPCPRDPDFYRDHGEPRVNASVGDAEVGRPTTWLIFRAIGHYVNKVFLSPAFPRRRNPFALPVFDQIVGSVARYTKNQFTRRAVERKAQELVSSPEPFFLALMQRAGDSQLWQHSNYTNETFAGETIESFSRFAPANARLVFKLHPLDPGMVDYERVVKRLAAGHGVSDRILFLDGGNLNTLARGARGAVTINSTAGLATIGFGCPTKVLGRAVYDIEGLTDRTPLNRFWNDPRAPDHDLFLRFRHVMMERTQINGAFYTPSGMRLAAAAAAERLSASD
jgi:capsular polysaccharide export protein